MCTCVYIYIYIYTSAPAAGTSGALRVSSVCATAVI